MHGGEGCGHLYASDVNQTVTLIAAELASNAVRHGHVPGRDFHLRLTLAAATASAPALVRVEVTDTRTEKRPSLPASAPTAAPDADSGRGLLLISRLGAQWSVTQRNGAPGKTVRAELPLP